MAMWQETQLVRLTKEGIRTFAVMISNINSLLRVLEIGIFAHKILPNVKEEIHKQQMLYHQMPLKGSEFFTRPNPSCRILEDILVSMVHVKYCKDGIVLLELTTEDLSY